LKNLKHAKTLIAAALLCASGIAAANQPNLSFVELGYGQTKVDDFFEDDSFSGFNFGASFELNESWYVPISYYSHTADDTENLFFEGDGFRQEGRIKTSVDFSQLSIGLGYQFSVTDNAIVTVDVNYLQLKAKVKGSGNIRFFQDNELVAADDFSESDSETEDGFSARVIYRNLLTESFQFNLGIQQSVIRIDSETTSDTAGIIEGLYHFNDALSLKLSATIGEDQLLVASARYSF
jgi:hypothetical protein